MGHEQLVVKCLADCCLLGFQHWIARLEGLNSGVRQSLLSVVTVRSGQAEVARTFPTAGDCWRIHGLSKEIICSTDHSKISGWKWNIPIFVDPLTKQAICSHTTAVTRLELNCCGTSLHWATTS